MENSSLSACTLVPEPNSSYLYNTRYTAIQTPISSPTMGIMMILSTLQYQAPHLDPQYQTAASQAGHAAYIVSGGQAAQDKLAGMATKDGMDLVRSIGINNTELGIVGFTAKTVRKKELDINGPRLLGARFSLTFVPDGCSMGVRYEW